jgi:hypothetical protein
MTLSVPTLVVSALVGGAAAVAVVVAVPTTPAPAAAAVEPGAPATLAPDAELLAQVERLAFENNALRERVHELELRSEARTPAEGVVTRHELDALREEVRGWLAGLDVQGEPSEFKEQVAETLSAIRKEEKFEAVRKGQEKRLDRLDDDVAKIEEWLELSPFQTGEMRTALLAQYDREDELRRQWEEGVEDEVLGEQKAADRLSFRTEVEAFLSVEQAETFWERLGSRGKN